MSWADADNKSPRSILEWAIIGLLVGIILLGLGAMMAEGSDFRLLRSFGHADVLAVDQVPQVTCTAEWYPQSFRPDSDELIKLGDGMLIESEVRHGGRCGFIRHGLGSCGGWRRTFISDKQIGSISDSIVAGLNCLNPLAIFTINECVYQISLYIFDAQNLAVHRRALLDGDVFDNDGIHVFDNSTDVARTWKLFAFALKCFFGHCDTGKRVAFFRTRVNDVFRAVDFDNCKVFHLTHSSVKVGAMGEGLVNVNVARFLVDINDHARVAVCPFDYFHRENVDSRFGFIAPNRHSESLVGNHLFSFAVGHLIPLCVSRSLMSTQSIYAVYRQGSI